jgi:agmatinase
MRIATRQACTKGSKFHHGGQFRQAVLAGVLDPQRSIQIGIRGGAEYLWEFSYDSGMTVCMTRT